MNEQSNLPVSRLKRERKGERGLVSLVDLRCSSELMAGEEGSLVVKDLFPVLVNGSLAVPLESDALLHQRTNLYQKSTKRDRIKTGQSSSTT
jgi:hypothetical protein